MLSETGAAPDSVDLAESDRGTQEQPASWSARVAAFVVDVLVGLGVVTAFVLVAWSTAQRDWLWWLCVSAAAVVLLSIAVNRLLLPGVTGWSLGRALTGTAVVRRDGSPVGPWRLLVRDIAHLLDTLALFVGWLWPLWDRRGRTFADLLVRTEVRRRDDAPARAGRFALIAVCAAAVLAVAAAVLGYTVVYRNDFRAAAAREQIAVAGPKIVESILSYDPATLQADFDRAQSLVTDGYRPQLVAQQQSITAGTKKAPIVANDYWVTNSAVLSSTEHDATMLILMQGQRGVAPDMRTITATVKVNFQKSGDGQWQVAALTVLAKPKPGGGGR
ncbi:RDD family protein [Mycolicibacterium komossense]|uniref:RDD family protein n=1 Tax=Mycolicibacterium komossense TaxID=1779 RepID=UPI003F497683